MKALSNFSFYDGKVVRSEDSTISSLTRRVNENVMSLWDLARCPELDWHVVRASSGHDLAVWHDRMCLLLHDVRDWTHNE